MKIAAHTSAKTIEAKGNAFADLTAKQAALGEGSPETLAAVEVSIPEPTWQQLSKLQEQAGESEKDKWVRMGAAPDLDNVWREGGKICLPASLYPAMAAAVHLPTHVSSNSMYRIVNQGWLAPGFSSTARNYCAACQICLLNNPGQRVKTPRKHQVRAQYPFQRLQIDYIQMPKSGPFEFVLVCIDLFSGWPESYPVKSATAKATAKKLITELNAFEKLLPKYCVR